MDLVDENGEITDHMNIVDDRGQTQNIKVGCDGLDLSLMSFVIPIVLGKITILALCRSVD